jgi:hypothetical protein
MKPEKPVMPDADVSRGTSALPAWRYRDPAEVAEKDELAAIKRTALRLIEDGKVEEARALAARAQMRYAEGEGETRSEERRAVEALFEACDCAFECKRPDRCYGMRPVAIEEDDR